MNLILDIGNSIAKIALFENERLAEKETSVDLSAEVLRKFTNGYEIEDTIICVVGQEPKDFKKWELKNRVFLDSMTPLPIVNKYASPSTLGYDRIASVVGASVMISNREILCIDMGTCITYDLLNRKREYLGGGISPGLELRFKSLNNYTKNLPLISSEDLAKTPFIGTTTEESIKSGVFFGVITEVNGIINKYKEKYPDLAVVLTGGNAELFESNIKSEIFAFPDSVLHGLNAILEYNK